MWPARFTLMGFVAVAAGIGALQWLQAPAEDADTVVVTPALREFVRAQLGAAAQAQPDAPAVQAALEHAIEEEVLYREGVRLGLDKDDLIIKRRVVQKMRFLLEGMTPLQAPTQEQLQAYLQANSQAYQHGETMVLDHVFFSRGKRGDAALFDARAYLAAVHTAQANTQLPVADSHPLSGISSRVDTARIARDAGQAIAERLQQLPVGQWSEPMNSALGVHVVRVSERTEGRLMTVEEAGERLVNDVQAAQREAVNEAALAAVVSRYKVEHE